jgi:hypothetical protein
MNDTLAILETTAHDADAMPQTAPMEKPVEMVNAADWIDNEPPEADAIMQGLFDTGDKVFLTGSSKTRKTFFALQLALQLCSGRFEFMGFGIPKARRVLFVQMEVKDAHFWRRVHKMARKLGISRAELGDRLAVVNGRGRRITALSLPAHAQRHGAEIVVVDPIYKLIEGDENHAVDVKPLLAAFDHLTESTGAAVLYIHHNAKGTAGDKEARDRGAGSGVIARDYDTALYLTEHRDGGELRVVESLARNYPPQDPLTIEWQDGSFVPRPDLAPFVKTSKDHRRGNGQAGPKPTVADALAMIQTKGPMLATVLTGQLRELGFTKEGASEVRDKLFGDEKTDEWKGGKPCKVWVGTPEAIARLKERFANPAAVSVELQENKP